MVSRRNYIAITSMMLVVCFLFLLPQYIKNATNPYEENIYISDEASGGEGDVWRQTPIQSAADLEKVDEYILYVGAEEDDTGYAVTSWAAFTKCALAVSSVLPDAGGYGARLPRMLIVEAGACDFSKDTELLQQWNEKGVTIVFAGLPATEQIRTDGALRGLLGIRAVLREDQELSAIRFFSGFLLGGDRIYGVETELDRKQMDLKLTAPWFSLETGTEVYVLGDVEEEILPTQPYRNERLPALIWRHALNGSNVFAVSGEYIRGKMGIGMLSAITAKDRDYYLYPVVNSQVMTAANFPGMAEENTQALTERYGRGQVSLNRDLLWPGMEAISVINNYRMSCFLMPQYDYSDEAEPEADMIAYYLKLLRECGGEAGISLEHGPEITLAEKWERDRTYLKQDAQDYQYAAAYMTQAELEEFGEFADKAAGLRSVCANLPEKNALFSFLNEKILCQNVTHDLLDYSFSGDIELNSLQTALGYTNVLLDMRRVCWPEENEPGWEKHYETYASNLHTYWKRYESFDRLTVSESDARIRRFLCMDYSESRNGDTISLQIAPFQSDAYFILRTHLEVISKVEGGNAIKLEEGAWLLHAERPELKIKLRLDDQYNAQKKE